MEFHEEYQDSVSDHFEVTSKLIDQMTKKYIRANLEYQYLVVDNFQDALVLEGHCKRGAIFGEKPLFNPFDQDA